MYRQRRRSLKDIAYEKYYDIKYRLQSLLYGGYERYGMGSGYARSNDMYRGYRRDGSSYEWRGFGQGAQGKRGYAKGGKRFRHGKKW